MKDHRSMNRETDTGRPAKIRRLDITNNHQLEDEEPRAPYFQQHPSLVGSSRPLSALEVYYDNGPTKDESILNSVGTASSDDPDKGGQESSECCYGMLCNIPTRLSRGLSPSSTNIPVDFYDSSHLRSKLDGSLITFDITCTMAARVVGELESVAEVQTQLYCHSKLEFPTEKHSHLEGRRRGKPLQSWFLNVIIFGPSRLEDNVGTYLARHKMYLQDPIGCERRVPYRNPHIIPPDLGSTIMTDTFDSPLGDLEIERLEAGPDLLAQLMEGDVPLPETEAPQSVTTPLFSHQKQALTFMMQREQGWSLDEGTRDIWSRQRDTLGRFRYINNISGYSTDERPLDFRGGLLADDMGLGKTLSMISLIAANQAYLDPATCKNYGYMNPNSIKTTLLIVPPALIQAWEKQFSMHLAYGALEIHVYHGQNRTNVELLGLYDVVITTYHTVSAIFRKHGAQATHEQSIFSLTWHRLILDEAHTIQNPHSQLTQACCALRSTRRWAITGTPIQNKLADFASIVKFLGAHPYSDYKTFVEEILRPWQNRHSTNAEGFLRLKGLVRAITISRTKAVVNLPPRVDQIHYLNFTPAERENYEAAKFHSKARLEEAISSKNHSNKNFNALSLLNVLRLICNHGLLARSTLERTVQPQFPSGRSPREISDDLFGEVLGGSTSCSICGANLLDDFLEGAASSLASKPKRIECDQIVCELCISDQIRDNKLEPSLQMCQDDSSATRIPDSDTTHIIDSMSTKINALVVDLYKHNDIEKSVVFSYWTNTLDFVQLMLNDKGILHTRIDGKTSLIKRKEALQAFQSDGSVRVILVSITCGGAGLDLTAGSRVYLLEPHWNPMIEEQALCRVHRVGQERNVTTIRYLIRDSFEEQIVKLQKRKKMLAEVTFSQRPLSEDGIGLGTLEYLKSVLE